MEIDGLMILATVVLLVVQSFILMWTVRRLVTLERALSATWTEMVALLEPPARRKKRHYVAGSPSDENTAGG